MTRSTTFLVIGIGALLALPAMAQTPLGTAFTYQGQLKNAGLPVNGSHDLRFVLYDAAVGGTIVAGPICSDNVAVMDGLFTVSLDFGMNVFTGDARWMEVQLRADSTPGNCASGSYTRLSPKQAVTPAPYALFASNAPWSGLSGVPAGFADGVDDAGALTLPYAGSVNVNAAAFSVTNTHSSAGIGLSGESEWWIGVKGQATNTVGVSYGGWFESDSASGRGVYGKATAATGSTYGVHGQSESDSGFGVYALAFSATGTNYGIYSRTNSPSGYAGYFVGGSNYFSGNVGIGTDEPASPLHILGSQAVTRMVSSSAVNGSVVVLQNDTASPNFLGAINFQANTGGTPGQIGYTGGHDMTFRVNGVERMRIDEQGEIGIGTTAPSSKLEVWSLDDNISPVALFTTGLNTNFTGDVVRAITGGSAGRAGSFRIVNSTNSNAALYCSTTGSGPALWADGLARVDVLEITGADVAEKFPTSDAPEAIKPGMVMEIDPDNAEKLRIARGAYNRRVAGVVSGAGDIPTGTILGNMPGSEDAPPIALSGRVYVYCDASNGAIALGDLLTTSDTPGHAMKVIDYPRAQGAIIGKAMSSLERGESGLVLVLVNLQ